MNRSIDLAGEQWCEEDPHMTDEPFRWLTNQVNDIYRQILLVEVTRVDRPQSEE